MTATQLHQLNEPLIDFAADISGLNAEAAVRTRAFNALVAGGGRCWCAA